MVSAVLRQYTFYKVACALHWSDSSDFDFSVKSKQLLKGGRVVVWKAGKRRECREGRKQEAEEQQRGKSRVTKTRHIPDKPLYHITTLHHTENNALILWEGGPYLHTFLHAHI